MEEQRGALEQLDQARVTDTSEVINTLNTIIQTIARVGHNALNALSEGSEIRRIGDETRTAAAQRFDQLDIRAQSAESRITSTEGRLTHLDSWTGTIMTMRDQVLHLEGAVSQINKKGEGGGKGILDCKAVANLKQLGADKSDYRNWEDRLINAYIQYAGK